MNPNRRRMSPFSTITTTVWISLLVAGCASQASTAHERGVHQAIADDLLPFHVSVLPYDLSPEGRAAFGLLRETCTFLDPDTPGAHSPESLAFARLLDERDAVGAFDALQASGSAAGRLWGLEGLARVAPDLFFERLRDHRQVPDMVFSPEGASTVATVIEQRWPRFVQLRRCEDM